MRPLPKGGRFKGPLNLEHFETIRARKLTTKKWKTRPSLLYFLICEH
jgi:hypothetical protein